MLLPTARKRLHLLNCPLVSLRQSLGLMLHATCHRLLLPLPLLLLVARPLGVCFIVIGISVAQPEEGGGGDNDKSAQKV